MTYVRFSLIAILLALGSLGCTRGFYAAVGGSVGTPPGGGSSGSLCGPIANYGYHTVYYHDPTYPNILHWITPGQVYYTCLEEKRYVIQFYYADGEPYTWVDVRPSPRYPVTFDGRPEHWAIVLRPYHYYR